MNKKFLVVALLAALSTVGYGAWHENAGAVDENNKPLGFIGTDKGNDNFAHLKNEIGKLNGELNQAYADLGAQMAEGDRVVKEELQAQLNDKVSQGELNQAYADLGAQMAEGDRVVKEELQAQLNDKVSQGELNQAYADLTAQMLEGDRVVKEDVDFIKGEVERVENDVTGLQNKLEDYDDVKENANSAIILGQANSDKIDDLYANKVDNSKFEEHKKEQATIDENQDQALKDETTARKEADEKLQGQINDFNDKFAGYEGRLSGLEKKVDHLDDKMNKGLSLMAAMNAVDFQNVQTGEMALGAGIGHYGNAQSVALGVAYAPAEDLTVNAKYSITAGDPDSFAVGAGATYKFKVGR